MKIEIRDRWTAALRSGEYEQGKNRLRTGDEFCCLGVFCDVVGFDLDAPAVGVNAAMPWARASGVEEAPPILQDLVPRGVRFSLAEQNDAGATFEEIADLIETLVPTDE